MSGSVVVRHATEVIGQQIAHDDRPLAWDEADRLAGRRLDRRKAWAFVKGELCEMVRWTSICSGCSVDYDYSSERGGGCHECGYHGVVRSGMWIPIGNEIGD